MKNSNKSQFLVFSAMFIFLLLIFIYSLETDNTYIVKNSKFNLIENIIYETCQVGKNSNGSYIDSRYSNFTNDVETYCLDLDYNCTLTIVNNTIIPPDSNWSKLNYTHYDYSLDITQMDFSYTGDFNC